MTNNSEFRTLVARTFDFIQNFGLKIGQRLRDTFREETLLVLNNFRCSARSFSDDIFRDKAKRHLSAIDGVKAVIKVKVADYSGQEGQEIKTLVLGKLKVQNYRIDFSGWSNFQI